MPYDMPNPLDITVPAAADLSSYQYRFVTIDANGRGTLATSGIVGIGILQNKPAAADTAAQVRCIGISKLVFGAAANEAAYLASGVQGCGTATTQAGALVLATVLHAAGGSGDVQDVWVQRFMHQ